MWQTLPGMRISIKINEQSLEFTVYNRNLKLNSLAGQANRSGQGGYRTTENGGARDKLQSACLH